MVKKRSTSKIQDTQDLKKAVALMRYRGLAPSSKYYREASYQTLATLVGCSSSKVRNICSDIQAPSPPISAPIRGRRPKLQPAHVDFLTSPQTL